MTTPPQIGIDARLLYYRKGGIPEYTAQLIEALAKLDNTAQYAVVHNFRDKQTYTPAANFKRVNAYTPAHHRIERTALSVEMARLGLDLFHSPDFIAPRRAAKKHLITIHDLHFLYYPQFQDKAALRYYRDQIGLSAQQADHIFVQTESTKSAVVQMLNVPAEKITVHLLGVNPACQILPDEEVKRLLAPYKLSNEYLLFVGTIEPRKNMPNLLKAYALLREKNPDVPRLVLGGQPGWHVTQELAALDTYHLHEHITWIQGVPDEVLPALYNGATALILPSLHEGFGMPAVEAMACGTPVIVTQNGAVPEVVGDAGLFIDPMEPEALAETIQKLLDDSQLQADLKAKGLARASTFTWQHTAQIVRDIYQQFI